jgi:hypothetical protein
MANIALAPAPASFEIFNLMRKCPVPLSRPTAAARARVVAVHDTFTTTTIYKWILMQLLLGFHLREKYSW